MKAIFRNHQTNTSHVCTYLNAFHTLISNIVLKFQIFEIFDLSSAYACRVESVNIKCVTGLMDNSTSIAGKSWKEFTQPRVDFAWSISEMLREIERYSNKSPVVLSNLGVVVGWTLGFGMVRGRCRMVIVAGDIPIPAAAIRQHTQIITVGTTRLNYLIWKLHVHTFWDTPCYSLN